jgi:DNA-directed RNA polymerase subunit RPC12/RpoP
MAVSESIDCMECGGHAHLVQLLDPEMPPEEGDVLVYVCGDCWQRWDVVVDIDDLDEDEEDQP